MKWITFFRYVMLCANVLLMAYSISGQCDSYSELPVQSRRNVHYLMDIRLDTEEKTAYGSQRMTWHNPSPGTVSEIRFYMYLNAFRDLHSTFIKSGYGQVFGENLKHRPKEEFGSITWTSVRDGSGQSLMDRWSYIHPDDDNLQDASVLSLLLDKPVMPGDSIVLDIEFVAKMPKIMARTGYSKNDYFLFVHWFPQPGVFQKEENGDWKWNCHQFFQQTEFYADFGTYKVDLTVPENLVLEATGCLTEEVVLGNGMKKYTYKAYDVIDFAWVVYPDFKVYTDNYKGIDINLLIPPEHEMLAERYIQAIKYSFAYLEEHVGPYPFPKISIIDPPLHALKSGLMEYPMLITCGSFYHVPESIRTIESLAIHEFIHMYFMATLASNEKEEPWLDEGFVTYFEDEILDHYYGENCSLFDLLDYRSGNAENSRLEYTRLPNPNSGPIARPGWEFETSYKGLIYSKTATVLKTMHNLVGDAIMDEIIKTYYERWKFRHPRGRDFITIANEVITSYPDGPFPDGLDWFFQQCLYEAKSVDYRVRSIRHIQQTSQDTSHWTSIIEVENLGDMHFPVAIEIRMEDGRKITKSWKDKKNYYQIVIKDYEKVVSAYIDPEHKIYLDLDLNNNSLTLRHNHRPAYKYGAKAMHWLQNILQWTSSII